MLNLFSHSVHKSGARYIYIYIYPLITITVLPILTENEHIASFPAWSMNVYNTCVVPIGKLSPGLCDLDTVGVRPELSVAVGSVHPTDADGVPNGMVVEMGTRGQPITTGGVVSSATSVNSKACERLTYNIFNDCYTSGSFIICKILFSGRHGAKQTKSNQLK